MKASSDSWRTVTCRDESQAARSCAELVGQHIETLLLHQQSVNLFVSGGKSPARIFDHLSQLPLHWQKVNIFLVDERWAPDSPDDQNQTLVQKHLLQHHAATARFNALLLDRDFHRNIALCNQATDTVTPDIVLLGMGLDGHTASLFPDAADYSNAMTASEHYVAVHPAVAPYPRISMSFHWLQQAAMIVLFIPGQDKKRAFQTYIDAAREASPLPALFAHAANRITVMQTEGGES